MCLQVDSGHDSGTKNRSVASRTWKAMQQKDACRISHLIRSSRQCSLSRWSFVI